MSSVLVVRFAKRSEVQPLVRAALEVAVAHVALAEAPPPGVSTLQVFIGDALVVSLRAELIGAGAAGEYALRVGPVDSGQAEALGALLTPSSPRGGASSEAPDAHPTASSAPPPRIFVDESKTLASRPADQPLARAVDAAEPRSLKIIAPRTPPPPSDEPTLPRASGPQPARAPFFSDDELQTMPGSSRAPGAAADVSWNVRIAPTTVDPLCGRVIGGGRYVLDSVIGTGAIGIVFKASHRDLGRTVAIKVLNPRYRDDADLLDVFRTEARAASQLEHPNVARIYDYGQEPDGLVYIVMEYLSGYTLGSVLDVRRKLTAARSVDLMVQVCAGLSAAHDRELVHRDVKPDNIVLVPVQDDEGLPVEIVKVCDFGIAALETTGAGGVGGPVAGTPQYMAPEQTTGAPVKASADVYGCGVVLYEMLTGQVPFTADQAYRILMKHRDEAPRPPRSLEPSIPAALEAVVLRCMEKNPAHRYQSARELRLELRKL